MPDDRDTLVAEFEKAEAGGDDRSSLVADFDRQDLAAQFKAQESEPTPEEMSAFIGRSPYRPGQIVLHPGEEAQQKYLDNPALASVAAAAPSVGAPVAKIGDFLSRPLSAIPSAGESLIMGGKDLYDGNYKSAAENFGRAGANLGEAVVLLAGGYLPALAVQAALDSGGVDTSVVFTHDMFKKFGVPEGPSLKVAGYDISVSDVAGFLTDVAIAHKATTVGPIGQRAFGKLALTDDGAALLASERAAARATKEIAALGSVADQEAAASKAALVKVADRVRSDLAEKGSSPLLDTGGTRIFGRKVPSTETSRLWGGTALDDTKFTVDRWNRFLTGEKLEPLPPDHSFFGRMKELFSGKPSDPVLEQRFYDLHNYVQEARNEIGLAEHEFLNGLPKGVAAEDLKRIRDAAETFKDVRPHLGEYPEWMRKPILDFKRVYELQLKKAAEAQSALQDFEETLNQDIKGFERDRAAAVQDYAKWQDDARKKALAEITAKSDEYESVRTEARKLSSQLGDPSIVRLAQSMAEERLELARRGGAGVAAEAVAPAEAARVLQAERLLGRTIGEAGASEPAVRRAARLQMKSEELEEASVRQARDAAAVKPVEREPTEPFAVALKRDIAARDTRARALQRAASTAFRADQARKEAAAVLSRDRLSAARRILADQAETFERAQSRADKGNAEAMSRVAALAASPPSHEGFAGRIARLDRDIAAYREYIRQGLAKGYSPIVESPEGRFVSQHSDIGAALEYWDLERKGALTKEKASELEAKMLAGAARPTGILDRVLAPIRRLGPIGEDPFAGERQLRLPREFMGATIREPLTVAEASEVYKIMMEKSGITLPRGPFASAAYWLLGEEPELLVSDPIKAMDIRKTAFAKQIGTVRWMRDLHDNFGRERSAWTQVPPGWRTLKPGFAERMIGHEKMYYPEAIAGHIENITRAFDAGEAFSPLARFAVDFRNKFAAWTVLPFMSTLTNNIVGGVFNYTAHESGMTWADAAKMFLGRRKNGFSPAMKLALASWQMDRGLPLYAWLENQKFMVGGRTVGIRDVVEMARKEGIVQSTLRGADIPTAFGKGRGWERVNPWSNKNIILQTGGDGYELAERMLRLGGFADRLEKGWTPGASGRFVSETQFRYDMTAPVHDTIRLYVHPFWNWMRYNTMFTLEHMRKRPAMYGLALHLASELAETGDPANVPPNWEYGAAFKIGVDKDGNETFVTGLNLPPQDTLRLVPFDPRTGKFSPSKTLRAALIPTHPLIQGLIEGIAGETVSGTPLPQAYGKVGHVGAAFLSAPGIKELFGPYEDTNPYSGEKSLRTSPRLMFAVNRFSPWGRLTRLDQTYAQYGLAHPEEGVGAGPITFTGFSPRTVYAGQFTRRNTLFPMEDQVIELWNQGRILGDKPTEIGARSWPRANDLQAAEALDRYRQTREDLYPKKARK